jgi:geranylgeranyl pyrophosphate synthase
VSLKELLEAERALVEAALPRVLPDQGVWPARLHRAMSSAVLAGGKRIRPVLARLACRAAGGDPQAIAEAVCGLELIHTYSLVHDDLPALDNDVLRRGRPTIHVAYDEATAILVGDALLTEGLLVLARHPRGRRWAVQRAAVVERVAEAISSRGMVGGQMDDLEATGQVIGEQAAPEARLERIHRHKTGCLLQASVETGALLAGVEPAELSPFSRYGETLGLAFQVADDILDATSSAAELGKSPGKDAEAGKLTYVTLFGLDSARRRLTDLETAAVALAESLEGRDGPLAGLAHYVAERRH